MIAIPVKATIQYEELVTVQILDDDGTLIECDHAGATEERLDYGGLHHDSRGDLDWFDDYRPTLVCDKPNCDFEAEIESGEMDHE